METADSLLIPEELPGQLTFVPETPVQPKPHHDKFSAEFHGEAVLTETPHIRILLCDVLARLEGSVPGDWLYEIMVGAGHISYFLYEDALGSLLGSGAVQQQGDALVLTKQGALLAQRFRHYVPKLFRDQVMLTALRYASRQKALRDLQISYEPDGSEWVLCLRCMDGSREMFYLRVHAPDKAAAEVLGERILRNPAGFFGKVIDLAVNNEEEQFDLTDN